MNAYLFTNAKVITPLGIQKGEIFVRDGKISKIGFGKEKITQANDAMIIDCQGNYLSPGFIDIHTHGGGGYDFMDGDERSIRLACKSHLKHGTTTIVPTTTTSTKNLMLETIQLFKSINFCVPGEAEILGLHLEGPYFAPTQAGAQDPRFLRTPDPKEYEAALKISENTIKRWSYAIELPGSNNFLNRLLEEDIQVSLAHSDASCTDVQRAYENGLSCLTHFYSAMSTVTRKKAYRIAGVIEAGYLIDDLYVEVIADGRHLPKELLQLIYKIKGPDRIILVTDSIRGAGMRDGEIIKLGSKEDGVEAIIEDGVAKLMDRSAFAGSVATTDRLVRTFRTLTQAPLHEVIRMITLNPAKLLKIDDRKGSIAIGKDADLLVFDQQINIKKIMVRGVLCN